LLFPFSDQKVELWQNQELHVIQLIFLRLIINQISFLMKRIKNPLLIIFLIIPFFSIAQSASDKEFVNTLDNYFVEKFPDDEPGISVLIVKNKNVLYRKAFGSSNVEKKTANTPNTIYQIGSITKQFTTVGILKLVEEGKINLQDPITRFLPDYPMKGKTITIEHLLTHTSGIKSYTALPDIIGSKESKEKAYRVNEIIDAFKNEPVDFEPGTDYLYNNSGYFLLGAIIEHVSGMTWVQYLQKNIFSPLKMNNTFADQVKSELAATGYYKRRKFDIADNVHPSASYAAGAISSNVDDLWKWYQGVFSYSLVKKELLEQAWTPLPLADGSKRNYGYGWQLGRLGNYKVIGHGGTIDGFQSFAMYVPEADVFATVLSNNMGVSPEEHSYRAAAIVMDMLKEPKTISLSEKELDEYVGVYAINATEERIVSKKGLQLYAVRTGGTKVEIHPYEKDKFYLKDSPARFEFMRNTKNEVVSMMTFGREFLVIPARRTDKPLPKERVAISLDTTVFDTYVGEYEILPGTTMTLKREKQKFLSQIAGQSAVEIFPETPTRFFLKVVDAQLEIVKNEKGDVVSVILYQGGRVLPAKRLSISGSSPVEKKRQIEITLDPALLTNYEGEYQLAPTFSITVTRNEDKLYARATGQGSAQLYPESELKFFYKIVDAQIEFVKGVDGKIEQLILYQGGQVIPGKKIK
jgi:CubicO group peptidase (beta-lactamase class C family)